MNKIYELAPAFWNLKPQTTNRKPFREADQ